MSAENVSNPETEENISEEESAYIPKEYTPYEPKADHHAEAEKLLAGLPERDYDGAVFFITTPVTDYIDPDTTETNVTRQIAERNRIIEDQYNISLITSLTDARTILTEMENAVLSDTYYTDLLMTPVYMTGQFCMADVLMNLRSLPFLDLDAPYFNSESADMTSAGYKTYGIAGDATLSPSAYTALFFNRDLVKEAGMDMPYSLVTAGTWTWEKLFEYTAAVTELNGQRENPVYIMGSQNNASRFADLVFTSCGNTYIASARKRVPRVSFTAVSAQYAVETAHTLITGGSSLIDAEQNAVGTFTEGDMLFLAEYLYVMPWMTNASADWGVLPLPKAKEENSYRTLISNNELIFSVPLNHTQGEFAAIILSALNAGSYRYLYDEYVEHNMIHVLRDNDSVNMLELVLTTAAFDFALAFGNGYPNIAAGTHGLIRESALTNDLTERFTEALKTTSAVLNEEFRLTY